VADKYPSAAVDGLDLSAIQPYYVPPNLKFIIDDIEEIVLKLPLGFWPRDRLLKRAGLYWRVAISDGLRNICSRVFTRGLGWTMEAIDVYLVEVRKSLHDASKHVYFPLYIVVGQKPETGLKGR
jgi:hypothetical protein